MKKLVVFIGLFLLTLHYNYADENIHVAKQVDFSHSEIDTYQPNEQQALELATVFTAISEFESSLQQTFQIYPSTLKNNSSHFLYVLKITEEIYASSFTQYILTLGNFTVKYSTAKIIFPFHYHW